MSGPFKNIYEQIARGECVAWVRISPGGKNLSLKMTHLLAVVMYDGWILFPSKRERECAIAYRPTDLDDSPRSPISE